jgi:hypothetical protein
MALHFDPIEHAYTLDGVRVPSVTQVIKIVGQDFSMVRDDVLEAKRQLGTAVHLACELFDFDELDDDTLDPVLAPYLAAWVKFKADTGAQVLANEQQLAHQALRFAGTIDRVALFDGNVWILDLKTSADPVPSYGVQLAGYAELFTEQQGTPVSKLRRATVHLCADGTYKLNEYKNPSDFAAFRACLALHNWKETTK